MSRDGSLEPTSQPFNHGVWDALPYIDPVNEPYEQYALSIIEQEMRQMNNSSRQRVELIPELVLRTETLRTAYQKYAQGTVAAAILEPASLPEPPAEESDTDAWREAVQRAKISYEAERIRSMQLEIEKEEGSDTSAAGLWKRYHQKVLEPQLAVLQKVHEEEQWNVAKINQERQQRQRDEYQPALYRLHTQYQELLQKQWTLKQAIANLKRELVLER
jgi:hypothetical protein